MKSKRFCKAIGILVLLSTPLTYGQQLMVYPNKGQSSKQQEKDKYECFDWAKKQTGFDPNAAAGVAAPNTTTPPKGGAVRGAAKGAAVGTLGGAIGGNTGKGAAIGAGVGAAGGAMKRREAGREQAQEQQQVQAQKQQQMSSFNKAEAVCLQGRGYNVS